MFPPSLLPHNAGAHSPFLPGTGTTLPPSFNHGVPDAPMTFGCPNPNCGAVLASHDNICDHLSVRGSSCTQWAMSMVNSMVRGNPDSEEFQDDGVSSVVQSFEIVIPTSKQTKSFLPLFPLLKAQAMNYQTPSLLQPLLSQQLCLRRFR